MWTKTTIAKNDWRQHCRLLEPRTIEIDIINIYIIIISIQILNKDIFIFFIDCNYRYKIILSPEVLKITDKILKIKKTRKTKNKKKR